MNLIDPARGLWIYVSVLLQKSCLQQGPRLPFVELLRAESSEERFQNGANSW